MTQFLKKLRGWLAKLAFWRKSAIDAALPSEAEPEADETPPRATVDDGAPESETPLAKLGVLARLKSLFTRRRRKVEVVADAEVVAEPDSVVAREPKQRNRASDASEEPEIPQPKLSFFARLRQSFMFRRKPVEAEAEPENVLEKSPQKKSRLTDEPAAVEISEPKPSFFARLKQRLSFRRKSAASEIEVDESDKTLVIDKAKLRSETTATADEAEAPQPSRLKRLLLRLRNKWVWIPTISLAAVGIISWVVVVMLHTTHEKERLQAELKAAKKMLEKKSVAAVAPPPLAAPAILAPAKPEKTIDPASQIIGHVPEPQAGEALGIDASDCVVKDTKTVAENLKNCILGFNQAIASAPAKTKKP